jgi:hypothetical protein
MQATMVHFCDKMVFFPWVPFIQMYMVTNISLDLLIGPWVYINNLIVKRIVWSFIDKKNSFFSINGLLKLKNMDLLSN